jgi:hypothetical protein
MGSVLRKPCFAAAAEPAATLEENEARSIAASGLCWQSPAVLFPPTHALPPARGSIPAGEVRALPTWGWGASGDPPTKWIPAHCQRSARLLSEVRDSLIIIMLLQTHQKERARSRP